MNMDEKVSVASSIVTPSVLPLPVANVPNALDIHNAPGVSDVNGGAKKSNKKKNKERAERARLAKAVEPDDVNYNDMCRQLATMQKELNAMKARVGISRPAAAKKTCAITAILPTNAVSTLSPVLTALYKSVQHMKYAVQNCKCESHADALPSKAKGNVGCCVRQHIKVQILLH